MKKKLDEYVTDIERVTKTWDWVQQKVFALIQSWNNIAVLVIFE